MRYVSFQGPFPDGWTTADVESAIARNNPSELLYVPLVVSMCPPGRVWSERVCVRLSTHPDPSVRGNALEGFGHLARVFRMLNRRLAEPVLLRGLHDPDRWVRSKAQDAVEDVEWFLGWVFPGREDRRSRRVCPR